eukprot:gene23679-6992_t
MWRPPTPARECAHGRSSEYHMGKMTTAQMIFPMQFPSTFKSIDHELRQHCGRDFPGSRDGRRGMRSF